MTARSGPWHHGAVPVDEAKGHVVLCGLGRVGTGILNILQRLGHAVTVISRNECAAAVAKGTRILVGDARDERLLVEAGIATARALIAATDDDLANVTVALHAHHANPTLALVVRLFDQDLGAQLKQGLGIRAVYSASALAAPVFVAAALGDAVQATFEVDGQAWAVEHMDIDGNSPWRGRPLADLISTGHVPIPSPASPLPDRLEEGQSLTCLCPAAQCQSGRRRGPSRVLSFAHGLHQWWRETPRGLRFTLYALWVLVAISVLVFAVALRLTPVDAYYFVMTTLTTTGYGDVNLQNAPPLVKLYGTLVMVSGGALFAVMFSMLTDLLLRTHFGDVMAGAAVHRRGHIIVAGLGHTGYRVLRQLDALGATTVAVESDGTCDFVPSARSLAPVVLGDASTGDTLRRAGLSGASTVLAVTNNDLANLSMAAAAKRVRPDCRVVVRVFDSVLAERLDERMGIDAVISMTDASAPTFAAAALDVGVVRGLLVGDRLLVIVERPAAQLTADEQPLLVCTSEATGFAPASTRDLPPQARVIASRWIALAS